MCRNVLTWRQGLQQWVNPPNYWTLPLGLEGTGLTIIRAICTFSPLSVVGEPLPLLQTYSLVVPQGLSWGMFWSLRRFFFRMYRPSVHFLFVPLMRWGSQGFCSERTGPGWTRSHTEKLLFMLTPTALTTALPRSKRDQVRLNLSPSSVGLSWPTDKLRPLAVASLDPSPGWAAIMHQPLPATFIR